MPRCRSTSFYLAPGELVYFKHNRVWALHPETGEPVEISHRDHLHAFLREHGPEETLIYLGPKGDYDALERMREHPSTVHVYRTCSRTIEGRRPDDLNSYLIHMWSASGLQEVDGAHQVATELLPGVGRANLGQARHTTPQSNEAPPEPGRSTRSTTGSTQPGGIGGRELDPDVRHKVVSLFSKIAVDGRDPYGDPYDDYDGFDD